MHEEGSGRDGLIAGEIYGTVVYLTVVVLLEEDRASASDAIWILLVTAAVFWLAHVYAHIVPRLAAVGRLSRSVFTRTAREQLGILLAVVVPVVPMLLAAAGAFTTDVGYVVAVIAGLAALGVWSLRIARSAGLSWGRAAGIAIVLVLAGSGLVLLELSVH
ncbi:MAG TPA: hypothetical protein VIB62_01645 [Actinomycetota bacterium]|jgi:hypothetical protein